MRKTKMHPANLCGFSLIVFIFINYPPPTETDEPPSLYTRRELEAIKKFRPMVSTYLTQDFMRKDRYLLRFLRSSDFDFEKAARRLENSANWRKENKMDGILNEDLRAHAKHLPYGLGGLDKGGYPFVYLPGGKWDFRKYVLAGKRDILLRFVQQMFERFFQHIWKVADETGKDIDQYHLLVNMEGFNAKQHLCIGCISFCIDVVAAYDRIATVFGKKLTLINSPRVATPLLNLLKSTFPFPPFSFITIYDNNADVWKKELLKEISPDQLLKKYGGTREE